MLSSWNLIRSTVQKSRFIGNLRADRYNFPHQRHSVSLQKADFIDLNIDYKQMGIGGDDSCGAQTIQNTLFHPKTIPVIFGLNSAVLQTTQFSIFNRLIITMHIFKLSPNCYSIVLFLKILTMN